MPEEQDQAEGQRRRFQALVLPHLDDAVNFAWWLAGNRADAEDIVQEAMLRAYKYFDRFTGERARPWLLTIVRNRAYDLKRRGRVRSSEVLEEGTAATREPSPLELAERSELNVRLAAAIETLTDTQREVLMMHDVEGWKHADIAALLGLAESTVRVHLLHARRRLRAKLLAVAPDTGPGEAVR